MIIITFQCQGDGRVHLHSDNPFELKSVCISKRQHTARRFKYNTVNLPHLIPLSVETVCWLCRATRNYVRVPKSTLGAHSLTTK